jgi:hypothetical protein
MLSGVHNFRDAGGYRTAKGIVRSNLLFRSGRLAAATIVQPGGYRAADCMWSLMPRPQPTYGQPKH